jgi:gamma-glutamyltranspeptidase / glutathione hydrolase
VGAEPAARGQHAVPVAHVACTTPGVRKAGACGMREPDGSLTGAACRRAHGPPIGRGGGHARRGIRFWPDPRVPR